MDHLSSHLPSDISTTAKRQLHRLPVTPRNTPLPSDLSLLTGSFLLSHGMATVDALDLKAFYARDEGGRSRNQPFHPAMMVKAPMDADATGVFSSRTNGVGA